MRLTTKGRFAVTAMIDLALREHSGPVALAAISGRQQISLSYLEQLFGKLRRHELVESTRGPGGGYSLGRKSEDITVADIIVAVDEPIDATRAFTPRLTRESIVASALELIDRNGLNGLSMRNLGKELQQQRRLAACIGGQDAATKRRRRQRRRRL